ncbi:MAG: acyl-ACP--UDP-N-acetylglucosamine O-acyltransferase [Planctomycetota bacterium]
MPTIHPTSQVDPEAELHDSVEVGPFCVIGAGVRLAEGNRLLGSNYLNGPLTMGPGNTVYPHACIGYAPQDRKTDPDEAGHGTVIGSDNVIREGVTIHRGVIKRPTKVGDRNYLMVNTHLGHDVLLGSDTMLANGVLLGGHVTVGDRAVLGGNAAVHQFMRIGRLAMISGVAAVTKDLPPFCTVFQTKSVGGLNLVGLRRAGLREHIGPLQKAFDLYYRRGLARPTALERMRAEVGDDPIASEFIAFIASSEAGVTPYARRGAAAPSE